MDGGAGGTGAVGTTPEKPEVTVVKASLFTSSWGCVMLDIVLWLGGPMLTPS